MRCRRCHTRNSIFWYPFSSGCDSEGCNGEIFYLCDHCMHEFTLFMRSYVVNDHVKYVPEDVTMEGSK